MAITILDPMREAELRKLWPWIDDDRSTEVWEGTTVMSPLATTTTKRSPTGWVPPCTRSSAGRGAAGFTRG